MANLATLQTSLSNYTAAARDNFDLNSDVAAFLTHVKSGLSTSSKTEYRKSYNVSPLWKGGNKTYVVMTFDVLSNTGVAVVRRNDKTLLTINFSISTSASTITSKIVCGLAARIGRIQYEINNIERGNGWNVLGTVPGRDPNEQAVGEIQFASWLRNNS